MTITKLEEIKRNRENAIEILEFFERQAIKDQESCNQKDIWESSYWKFLVKSERLLHYIERLYEKERNKSVKRKTGDQPENGTN